MYVSQVPGLGIVAVFSTRMEYRLHRVGAADVGRRLGLSLGACSGRASCQDEQESYSLGRACVNCPPMLLQCIICTFLLPGGRACMGTPCLHEP